MMTGNVRYVYISVTLLAAVALVLVGRLLHLSAGSAGAQSPTEADGLTLLLLVLTAAALVVQRRTHRVCDALVFSYRAELLEQGVQFVRTRCLEAGRWLRYERVRNCALLMCHAELLCFAARHVLDADGRHSRDAQGEEFMHAVNMGIHVGWTLGNGYHGVLCNSLKNLRLFGLAKIVFGLLAWAELLLGRDTSGVHALYCVVQTVALVCVNDMRLALEAIGFDTDRFIPPGSSSESKASTTLLTAKHGGLAAFGAVGCYSFFLAEAGLALCWAPSLAMVSVCATYALHGTATFVLAWRRSVMDGGELLETRKTIYCSMFALFLGVSAVGAVEAGAARGAFDPVFVFCALRCVVLTAAVWGFRVLGGVRTTRREVVSAHTEQTEEGGEGALTGVVHSAGAAVGVGASSIDMHGGGALVETKFVRMWRQDEACIRQAAAAAAVASVPVGVASVYDGESGSERGGGVAGGAPPAQRMAHCSNAAFLLCMCCVLVAQVWVGADEHAAFATAFHFCFVVFGYGFRGVQGANVNFLSFAALSNACFAVCGGLYVWVWVWSGGVCVWVVAASVCVCATNIACMTRWRLFVEKNLDLYPQTGFAVT
jgi:hypothetical protein